MSTTRSIASNTAIQIIGKAISTLLGLLAVAIMTRSLGVEKFGWYVTATGFLQFVGILCDFGFTVTTAKMLSEPRFDKTQLFNNFFTWRLLTAVFFQGSAAVAIWFFPYPTEIKIATVVLALSFIANILNQVFVGFYQTKLKMYIQMAGEVVGRVILVVGVALAATGKFGFIPMMWAVVIGACGYTMVLINKSDGIKLALDKTITVAIFQKMWPTALAVIFNAFYLQGDRVLLPLYASAHDVAFYGAAYRVLDIMSQVAFMTMGVMLPLLTFAWSRADKENFKKYYQLSFDLMMLVLIPIVVGTIVLSEPIMRIVAGNEFAGAGKILALLAISTLGVCFGMTFGQMALAIDNQRQAVWIYAIDAIVSVVAYFIFIPRYGMYGAAYVTIFSEFFAGIGLLALCAWHLNLWPKIFTALKIILASTIMGSVIYRLQLSNIIYSVILGIITYAILIPVLNIISRQTIREIIFRSKTIA